MSQLVGIDFDEFLTVDAHNRQVSLDFLRGNCYWRHFAILSDFYSALQKDINPASFSSQSLRARQLLFRGCVVNLFKALSATISGHISDGGIYVRRTIEAQKKAIFLRERPDEAELWFKTVKRECLRQFEDRYKVWYRERGHVLTKVEIPSAQKNLGFANHLGPHSNYPLALVQNTVEQKGELLEFRVNFHELENNDEANLVLASQFFWILSCHFEAAFWWLRLSKLHFDLPPNLREFWEECFGQFSSDFRKIRTEMAQLDEVSRSRN